ncbi:MAG: hypothetical protein JXA57_11795 [Armatimonadetes bacterium]|nr:hypothetical protein [Armatimonadota bacterium]
MDLTDRLLLVLVVLALAAAVFLASGRARIETGNPTVEIVLDADDARLVARASGVSLPVLLDRLREAGATSVAVREITVGELTEQGRIAMMATSRETMFITPDAGVAGLLAAGLRDRLTGLPVELASPPPIITAKAPPTALLDLPVMLRPEDVAAAEAAGLRVVARLKNFPGATPEAVQAAVGSASEVGASLIIFDGDEVLGYDGLITTTEAAFREKGLLFGYVEMAEQRGDAALLRGLSPRVARVHSISESDMLTMRPDVAVPRYARAVSERNIRVVYVRLMTRAHSSPSDASVRYVAAIAKEIREKGFTMGEAQPWSAPPGWPPKAPRVLIGLGVLAGLLLMVRRFVPLPAGWSWLLFALSAGAGTGIALVRPVLAGQLGGLGAAVAFPTLATIWAVLTPRDDSSKRNGARLMGAALARLLVASVLSLTGATMVVALHTRVGYLLGVAPFTGVKISLGLPLVLVFVAAGADVTGRVEALGYWWIRLRVRLRQFLSQPVTFYLAGVVVLAVAALALVLTRSGNAPALAPSGLEIKMRSLLETVLAVRPRTKEFLLGHPALMLGAALALSNRRTWLPLVAVVAALGQVSVLNTYCHFHTPLVVSLTRTANGLWLGAILGLITILVWRWCFGRARTITS